MSRAILSCIVCMVIGYCIGMVNPAFLMARMRGFDIREKGSGNAGASNAVITMGKMVGLIAALLDIAKAYFAVRIAQWMFPDLRYAAEITGVCTILGHIFPATMGFRGGKGLAALGGVILAFDARVFWIMLTIEVVLALIVDYIAVVPLTASVAFPVVYHVMRAQLFGTLLYAAMAPVFFYKHTENIKRILNGTEAKFSYLWSKDEKVRKMAEDARVK